MKTPEEETLYIVMPAYNEAENITATVKAWYPILKNKSKHSRLVIADSGSSDDTHKTLKQLQITHPQLETLDTSDPQHGPKVIALYDYAIKQGADYIFQTDSDGQTNPAEFADFWCKRKSFDAILGHRSSRGDGKARAFVEKVVCFLLKLFFDVRVPDANAPFRLMKSPLVAKYLSHLPENYNLPNIMLTAYFARFGEKITFQEISFKPRTAGKNSINLKKIFGIGRKALKDFLFFRKDMRVMNPAQAKALRRHKLGTLAILAIFGLVSLAILITSPSHPWNRGEPVTDSGVFLTVGSQIKAGLLPYRDTFDHKGPFLYLINYLGVLIHQNCGIVVLECLTLFFTMLFIYKIARLKCPSRFFSVFISLASMTLYLNLNLVDRGNLTEEYAMPFIALSLYVFLRYFLEEQTTRAKVFLVGLCFACVALLRLNMVALWGAFCLIITVRLVVHKSFRELGSFILYFLLGAAAISVPIFIWLGVGGALPAFVDTYLVFNSEYAALVGSRFHVLATAIYFLSDPLLIATLGLTICYVYLKSSKLLSVAYLISFIFVFYAVSMSGREYPHYGMILLPLLAFPLASLFGDLLKLDQKGSAALVAVVLICGFIYPSWLKLATTVITSARDRRIGEPVAASLWKPCEIIESLTTTEDRISVYGNRGAVYLRCNRLPATKYSYQFPISQVRPEILDEYFVDLATALPKIIVTHPGYNDERIEAFVKEHQYKLEWAEDAEGGARVYSRI